MKQKYYLLFSCALLLFSCNTTPSIPNTDIDVAREFIKDIQQSDFKKAEKLLLKEETNNQYFERFEEHFKSRPKDELEQYKTADIIINEMSNVNDSVTVINYSNSFNKAEKNKLKVVKVNGQWLIDLKYTFSGNL
jgi:type IV secretory pathway component VirB8